MGAIRRRLTNKATRVLSVVVIGAGILVLAAVAIGYVGYRSTISRPGAQQSWPERQRELMPICYQVIRGRMPAEMRSIQPESAEPRIQPPTFSASAPIDYVRLGPTEQLTLGTLRFTVPRCLVRPPSPGRIGFGFTVPGFGPPRPEVFSPLLGLEGVDVLINMLRPASEDQDAERNASLSQWHTDLNEIIFPRMQHDVANVSFFDVSWDDYSLPSRLRGFRTYLVRVAGRDLRLDRDVVTCSLRSDSGEGPRGCRTYRTHQVAGVRLGIDIRLDAGHIRHLVSIQAAIDQILATAEH